MAKDRQSSWAAGELSPDLHSQVGSPVYRSGAALLRNYQVNPQGLPVNRTGSQYLATLGSQTARLERFLFGDDEPRIVQMYAYGQMIMRKPDGTKAQGSDNDTTGDSVAPSREVVLEALRKIRVAQCAGTLMYSEPSTPPMLRDTRRRSATEYEYGHFVDLTPPQFGSSANPYSTADNKRNPAIQTSAAAGITIKAMAGDATHPPREWDYCVTRVVAIEDGDPDKPNQVLETGPRDLVRSVSNNIIKANPGRITHTVDSAGVYTAANVPKEIAVYGDWTQRVDVGGEAGDPWVEHPSGGGFFNIRGGTIVAHRVYRGRHGVYGYIGETTTRFFVDDGRDPDIANPPPVGSLVIDSIFQAVAVAFANDRRIVANEPGLTQRIRGSAVGNWGDFDEVITPDDADSLSFDLAANEHQSIRHLLPASVLLAFTSKKAWAISGAGDLGVLTPTSIAARPVASVGSAHYPAPIEGDSGEEDDSAAIFFVEEKGRRAYALRSDANGRAQLRDLTLFSPHFFKNRKIVSWAWARDPFLTLWVVLDNGSLLSLCYSPSSGVQAWAKHTLAGGGLVESVTTLAVGGEDLLYMAVKRGDLLTLERLAPQVVSDTRLECYLDCATIVDRRDLYPSISTVFDASNSVGGAPGDLEISRPSVFGGSPYLQTYNIGDVVMFYDPSGAPVVGVVTDGPSSNRASISVTSYDGEDLAATFGHQLDVGEWGFATSVVSTPALADGTVVTAVIDGAVYTDLVVAGGQVALPRPGIVVVVGLPYVSDMMPLPIEQERGKQKQVSHTMVEAIGSGGATGVNFDNLQEIPARTIEDGYDLLASKQDGVRVPVASSADTKAIVVIRQSQPKPLKILAVEREYVLGG